MQNNSKRARPQATQFAFQCRQFLTGLALVGAGVGIGVGADTAITWFATHASSAPPRPQLPAPTPTKSTSFGAPHVTQVAPIAGGLQSAIGCQVEYAGNLSVLSSVNGNPSYHVLGNGYTQLEAISVASDGDTVYMTQRSGGLAKVSLSALHGPNRANAQIIAPTWSSFHQFVLK